MTKYHINTDTDRVNICRADKNNCPLGADAPHFESKDDAKKFMENTAKQSHDCLFHCTRRHRKRRQKILTRINLLTLTILFP